MSTATVDIQGRPHHGAASRDRLTAAGHDAAQVRAWAHTQGFPVGDRGLLPVAFIEAYLREVVSA